MLTQILALILHLEAGWQPVDTVRGYVASGSAEETPFYGTLGVELVIAEVVFVGLDVRTEMTARAFKPGEFSPHLMSYGFAAGLRLAEGVELGFRHRCLHPIIPYMRSKSFNLNFEGAYQEVYLKIDKKIPLF